MVTMQRIRDGILTYIDEEVLPQMTGAGKVMLAVYAALAADNVVGMVKCHLDDPAVKLLGLTDENGMVDAERLRGAMLTKMGDEKIEMRLPVIGVMRFDRNDVEKLFRYVL